MAQFSMEIMRLTGSVPRANQHVYGLDAKMGRHNRPVVVDGVTTRNGAEVVAIRDPHGVQYFSPKATFQEYFTGEVVVPRSP